MSKNTVDFDKLMELMLIIKSGDLTKVSEDLLSNCAHFIKVLGNQYRFCFKAHKELEQRFEELKNSSIVDAGYYLINFNNIDEQGQIQDEKVNTPYGLIYFSNPAVQISQLDITWRVQLKLMSDSVEGCMSVLKTMKIDSEQVTKLT